MTLPKNIPTLYLSKYSKFSGPNARAWADRQKMAYPPMS